MDFISDTLLSRSVARSSITVASVSFSKGSVAMRQRAYTLNAIPSPQLSPDLSTQTRRHHDNPNKRRRRSLAQVREDNSLGISHAVFPEYGTQHSSSWDNRFELADGYTARFPATPTHQPLQPLHQVHLGSPFPTPHDTNWDPSQYYPSPQTAPQTDGGVSQCTMVETGWGFTNGEFWQCHTASISS